MPSIKLATKQSVIDIEDAMLIATDDITTLNGDDTTAGSVLKSIKEQAQKGDFAPTVASGIESETLEEAVNEVGVDVEAVKGTDWTDETVKGNAEDIATLNGDDSTEGSVAKSIKDNAENATITYTIATALTELASGETLTVLMGKLAKANATVIAQLDGKSAYRGTLIASGGNIDTIILTGPYTCYGTTTGVPNGDESWFIIHLNSDVNNSSAGQIAIGYTTGKIYFRTKTAGTWGAWSVGVTPTELGYLSGATSNIQEQLNLKSNTADIVDSLTSEDGTKILSAKQGKILGEYIGADEIAQKITDGFDRDDSDDLGTADTGETWIYPLGTLGITSNKAIAKTTQDASALLNTSFYNLAISVDLLYAGNNEIQTIIFRSDGTLTNRMMVYIDGSNIYLQRRASGHKFTLATYAYVFPIAETINIKIIADSDYFYVYIDNVLVITYNDDNVLKTNTFCGLQSYKSSTLCSSSFDNFSVENISFDSLETRVNSIDYWKGKSFITLGDSITWHNKYQILIMSKLKFDSYLNTGESSQTMADNSASGIVGTVTDGLDEDYTNMDLAIIASGTNDFRFSVSLGTLGIMGDTGFDRDTFYGAYRTLIEYILTEKPAIRIMLCTPMQRTKDGYDVNYTNTAGNKLIDYANAIIDIGELYSLPVCDLYRHSGFSAITIDYLTDDGLHPSTAGYERMAEVMSRFIYTIGI